MSSMCGIVDMSKRTPDFEEIRRMGKGMTFRSRGNSGAFLSEGVGFLQRGGNVVYDKSGRDFLPYVSKRGDYTYVIMLDGQLESISGICLGMGFWGYASDEEIILDCYLSEGIDCLSRLEGSFALCIYDGFRRQTILARDAFGGKPLYYYSYGDELCFASEIKGLLSLSFADARVDIRMLEHQILGELQAGGRIYKSIKEVECGQCMILSGFGVQTLPCGMKATDGRSEILYLSTEREDDRGTRADIMGILQGLVIAYDYPSFDMAVPTAIYNMKKNKKSVIPNWDDASDAEKKYFYERADRLSYLISELDIDNSISKRDFSQSIKQLERMLGENYRRIKEQNRGNIMEILKMFDTDMDAFLKKEKNIASRIGILGRLCQLAIWAESYSPVF